MDPISDIMTPEPLKVSGDTPMAECRNTMRLRGRRHLPVVDAQGQFIGLVTDHAVHLAAPDELARDVAAEVPACTTSTPFTEALGRLAKTTGDALMVLDAGRHPVGIVTEHDVVRLAPALLDGAIIEVRRGRNPLQSVTPGSSQRDAFYRMIEHEIRHLPVIEDGTVHGVVSMRDLLASEVLVDGDDEPIQELLKPDAPVYSVSEGVRAVKAANEMARFKVGCLLLTDEQGQPVGIVTRADLLDWILTLHA
jgi:CBS domain-containing protein